MTAITKSHALRVISRVYGPTKPGPWQGVCLTGSTSTTPRTRACCPSSG